MCWGVTKEQTWFRAQTARPRGDGEADREVTKRQTARVEGVERESRKAKEWEVMEKQTARVERENR